jgi:glycerate 2-kinase
VSLTVLISPDSFKGTFSAFEVADALAQGAESAGATCIVTPLADGGEGTAEILARADGGSSSVAHASDPLGRKIRAEFFLSADWGTAFIDVAAASGMGLVGEHERDALAASTYGTGQLMVAARDLGVSHIVIGAGGSATTDGGVGALRAIDEAGGLKDVRVTVLSDVTTPFEDAAKVFAPQKGADQEQVPLLTERLAELAEQWPRDPRGVRATGAAGGLSGGFWAVLNAEIVSGIDFVLDAVGFDDELMRVSGVITGEGRLDGQTLQGKVIAGVRARCLPRGILVHAVVGQCTLEQQQIEGLGLAAVHVASTRDQIVHAAQSVIESLDL